MRPEPLPPNRDEKTAGNRRRLTPAGRDTRLGPGDPRAEERVETVLTILLQAANRILEEEKIEVGDEDLDTEIAESAGRSNMTAEQARENVEKNNMLDYIRDQLRDRKLFDFLLENAVKTKGKKVKYLDLVQNNQ